MFSYNVFLFNSFLLKKVQTSSSWGIINTQPKVSNSILAQPTLQKKIVDWQVPTGISQTLWQSIMSCHNFHRTNAVLQRGSNFQFPAPTKCDARYEFPLPEGGHNWLALSGLYACQGLSNPAKIKTGNRKVRREKKTEQLYLAPRTCFRSLPMLAGKILQPPWCIHTDLFLLCSYLCTNHWPQSCLEKLPITASYLQMAKNNAAPTIIV